MNRIIAVWLSFLAPCIVEAGSLEGIVRDGETSAPLVGAWVLLEDGPPGAETDARGKFEFPSVSPGTYTLRVSHVGYEVLIRQGIQVAERATGVLQLVMLPSPIPLEEMVVSAQPIGQADVHRTPSFVTVLKRDAFEGRVTSVPEVLATATGVQLKQLGGLGSFSTISVRGSSAEQVEIYLDGILLNTAFGGGVNLSNLPLNQIEQIELYRGAASEGGGIGGAVHIRTRSAREGRQQSGTASWGSFNTRSMSATTSDRTGAGDYLVTAAYLASDNDFRFLDDNGTPYNPNDDAVTRRVNSDFASGNLLGKWGYRVHRTWKFYVQEHLYWSHKGIPGISSNQSRHARLNTFRSLLEAGMVIPDLKDRFTVRQRIIFSHKGEAFVDRKGEVGIGIQDNRYRTRRIEWSGRAQAIINRNHSAGLGISIRKETFRPESRLQDQAAFFESSRWVTEARAGTDWALPGNRGIVSSSFRVQHSRSRAFERSPYDFSPLGPETSVHRSLLSSRVGLRLDVRPGFWLKANLGWSARLANFFELFGNRGGVIGNSGLAPESATAWDAGFRAQSKAGELLEIAYFEQIYEDLIQFVQTSQGTSRAFNIGRAHVRGLEITAVSPLWKRLSVSGNYTFQRAVDRSNIPHHRGRRLPGRPAHETHLRTDLRMGRAVTFHEYTFEGGNFLDRANLRPVPARHVHNLGIRVPLAKRARMTFEAKNLRDTRIADVWGYPLPGRSYFITLQGRL